MEHLLERYRSGEYEQVWAELLALGEGVREEPLYTEAIAVARETMRRARYNIELLIPRLQAAGYVFGYHWLEAIAQSYEAEANPITPEMRATLQPERLAALEASHATYDFLQKAEEIRAIARQPARPFTPPLSDVQESLSELEHLVGPMPLALRAWYETVDAVDFVGTCPQSWTSESAEDPINQRDWSDPALDDLLFSEDPHTSFDPLFVSPLQGVLHQVKGIIHSLKQTPDRLEVSPDGFFKYWASGGGPYWMAVPNGAIDGEIYHEWHHTTFVGYLRLCFRWAGLPELDYFTTKQGKEALQQMTEGLLPL